MEIIYDSVVTGMMAGTLVKEKKGNENEQNLYFYRKRRSRKE